MLVRMKWEYPMRVRWIPSKWKKSRVPSYNNFIVTDIMNTFEIYIRINVRSCVKWVMHSNFPSSSPHAHSTSSRSIAEIGIRPDRGQILARLRPQSGQFLTVIRLESNRDLDERDDNGDPDGFRRLAIVLLEACHRGRKHYASQLLCNPVNWTAEK